MSVASSSLSPVADLPPVAGPSFIGTIDLSSSSPTPYAAAALLPGEVMLVDGDSVVYDLTNVL